jgi:hypothetical protein
LLEPLNDRELLRDWRKIGTVAGTRGHRGRLLIARSSNGRGA